MKSNFPLSLALIPLMSSFSFAFTPTEERNIGRLKELVSINSGSANFKGVLAVQMKIKPWLEELGFKVEYKKNPEGDTVSGPLMLGVLQGEKPEMITFIMHADTVFEPSSPFQKWEMIDEYQMKGPGVIDDKGGIIVTLQAIEDYLKELKAKNQKPKYTLAVEITPNEEVGAIGWWKFFEELSQKSVMALGLEPSYKNGIVKGRKGNIWYEISVTGKESHAGAQHEKGINACDILSGKITQISKLTDYKKNVTVSVGRMEGGQDKFNIVCGWAKAKVDSRVPDLKARETLNSKIEKILKHPAITFKIVDETHPLGTNERSKPYIQNYLKIIETIEGKKPEAFLTGGVGDANHFAREGIIIIDGLGPAGDAMHTPEERIDLRTISTRAHALREYLLKF